MKHYFNLTTEETLNELKTNLKTGLSTEEVRLRREQYGLNELKKMKKRTFFAMFVAQFKSFMILILMIAAAISGYIGITHGEGLIDVYIILGIVILNAIIGAVQEKKAESSLEALQKLSAPKCDVIRDSKVVSIPSKELVPGDIVIMETGDLVPADIRIISSINLKIQESAMTGESVPVEKKSESIEGDNVPLGDRINMAFSSGIITYGHGTGIVTNIGMETEVGKIAGMIQNASSNETPMSRRLEQLGKILGIGSIAICALIFVIGLLYGNSWIDMLMTAISLAVAAIPEGLPAISTVVLAMGVQRMVKRNGIIRTLPSVETLGSATVICSDKTGTLTQNKMTVVELSAIDQPNDDIQANSAINSNSSLILSTSIICSDAILSDGKTLGDPTETALLDAGLKYNLDKNVLEEEHTRVDEIPFDSDRKLMSTVNKWGDKFRVNTKGGLDELLACCTNILIGDQVVPITEEHKEMVRTSNTQMAENALRVLGTAYKELDNLDDKNYESKLTFIGILGMIDPARPEAKEAVKKCVKAGIKTVMITGDHKITASAIAKEIGILREGDKVMTGVELAEISDDELYEHVYEYSVYARVAPEHKVKIVNAFQRHSEVVAMTGDGVNDAPALKKADIGAAMGIVGTDVAKDASDLILTDDNFATIVTSVEEGRRIYDNILKSIQFLLSTNIGEVSLLFITSLLNMGMPLLPIHILWINLVTDSLPALAISLDPADKNIMDRKPRSTKTGIFTKGMVWRIVYQGFTFGLTSLVGFIIGSRMGGESLGQTMAFVSLVTGQLLHVRNLHSNRKSFFHVSFRHNLYLLAAIALSLALMLVVVIVPSMRELFSFAQMNSTQWWICIGLAMIPLATVELIKLLKLNASKDEY